ncbi:MAG TPA: hypothetical protein VLI05_01355 [Candidatus Saccharimonadia bacterium]|nr:hypothetical protein [Candidatus Saccharimonadia bacterium]
MRYGVQDGHGRWCFGPTTNEQGARDHFAILSARGDGYTFQEVPDDQAAAVQRALADGTLDDSRIPPRTEQPRLEKVNDDQ